MTTYDYLILMEISSYLLRLELNHGVEQPAAQPFGKVEGPCCFGGTYF